MSHSDDTLVLQTRNGDLNAFEILVERYERRLLRYLGQYVGNGDAEDLLQDTFFKAFRCLSRYRTGRSFNAWLYAIARNTAISHLRKRRPEAVADLPEGVDNRPPNASLAHREASSCVWCEVRARLGERAHAALWLMYAEDMSIKEIAAALNASVVSTKVLLHRARRKLAATLPDATVEEQTPSMGERLLEGVQG